MSDEHCDGTDGSAPSADDLSTKHTRGGGGVEAAAANRRSSASARSTDGLRWRQAAMVASLPTSIKVGAYVLP